MEIPNWLRWAAILGLIIWLISDPKGMAQFITGLWDGVTTFFGELG